jgi:hypothetical protein
MKSVISCVLVIFTCALACRQKETTSHVKDPGIAGIQTKKASLSDSFYIYKVINDIGNTNDKLGIKVHLTDEDIENVEEIVEPTLMSNNKDNVVIQLSKETLTGFENISLYDSLYFYTNLNKIGEKKYLKRFEYHLTPIDAFVLAIYEKIGPGRYVYATNFDSMEPICIWEKKNNIPTDVKSLQPKKSEVQYFECEDKSYRLVSFYTDSKSHLYFYKDKNKPELVYTTSSSNIVVDITILPVFIRDKPILFVSLGYSHEDYIEEKLMIFNGRHYEIMEGNRINKNK